MRWIRHVARVEEMTNAYKIFVGKTQEKRPLGRTRSKRELNIRLNLMETGWGGVD